MEEDKEEKGVRMKRKDYRQEIGGDERIYHGGEGGRRMEKDNKKEKMMREKGRGGRRREQGHWQQRRKGAIKEKGHKRRMIL